MGMGRYIHRRKNKHTAKLIITAVLFMCGSYIFAGSQQTPGVNGSNGPLEIQASSQRQALHLNLREGRLPSVQGHTGPEIYSIAIPEHHSIDRFVKKFATGYGRQYILQSLKRGEIYSSFIREALQKHNMPPELIFLPVIESSYVPHAYSPAGASGLWQFVRIAAGPLRINSWMDERRDFWLATERAIITLKSHYDVLGDWYLALAAYNAGINKIKRAIRASGINDYWQLADKGYLPKETADYVPKFLAVVKAAMYPGRNQIKTLNWTPDEGWTRINLPKQIDLSLLARATGIPLATLKAGNAELNYNVTPPAYFGYKLKVPNSYLALVQEKIASATTSLLKLDTHYIAAGDTFYDIARHYRISIAYLQQYNPRLRADRLQIGQKVVIPVLFDVGPYVSKRAAVVAAPPKPAEDNRDYRMTYVVKDGDTLWSISRAFNATVANLAKKNGISANQIIHPGDILKVPPVGTDN